MFFHNLARHVTPFLAKGAVAAGDNDTQTSSAIDLGEDQGVYAVVSLGTITSTGTGTIKLQHSSDDAASDAYADVAGSGYAYTDADSGKLVVIDLYRPQKRYVKVLVVRDNNANTVINSIVALLYHVGVAPETPGTTVANVDVITNAGSGTP